MIRRAFIILFIIYYSPFIVTGIAQQRALWASINSNAQATQFGKFNNIILISWRSLPDDADNLRFDLYRVDKKGKETLVNPKPITRTCYQDKMADRSSAITYRLKNNATGEVLDTYTLSKERASKGLPYISIPLHDTEDIDQTFSYGANDASIGDLDGDGTYEIVLKRMIRQYRNGESYKGKIIDMKTNNYVLLEAYRLDGTFLWRVCLGPNILTGNITSFAVYDFDGDGRAEIATRTAEGTVFGDGTAIGDTDSDGRIDYRDTHRGGNISEGPEFLSVIDGMTGKELARSNYIPRGTSEEWGAGKTDNYFHRASSYRVGVAKCTEDYTNIIIGRGCYGKIVVEAWDYIGGKLTRRWNFDTRANNGYYKAYEEQGYHSFRTGDVDGDGLDEVVYGSMTVDHDGKGLNCCRLGHGDAIHLGKFDPSREGLQIWSCFESGETGAALRDAKTGEVIWKHDDPGDVGRCMVADIDATNPGCEMWWVNGNAHSADGRDLGYKPGFCNMAIWFTGSLNRQLLDGNVISACRTNEGRVFTMYRYGVVSINSSKKNPCWYGDIVGDWREEVLMVDADHTELRLFSTWFPTKYTLKPLMTDHVYEMSAVNQNIGYNQPTHTGFYLGSDLLKQIK